MFGCAIYTDSLDVLTRSGFKLLTEISSQGSMLDTQGPETTVEILKRSILWTTACFHFTKTVTLYSIYYIVYSIYSIHFTVLVYYALFD